MSKGVLLSIKPVFAERIFSGHKLYEFRKTIFRNRSVEKIYVYASSPISKVIGEFQIEGILKFSPEELWFHTNNGAGITKEFFDSYFKDRDFGYAIKIGSVYRYKKPLDLKSHFFLRQAPQSFAYVPQTVNYS